MPPPHNGFLNSLNLQEMTPIKLLKVTGAGLLGLIVLLFALQIIGSALKSFGGFPPMPGLAVAPSMPSFGYGGDGVAEYDVSYSSDYYDGGYGSKAANSAAQLSVRNVASTIYPPQPGSPTGDSAEEFEVTQYNANIETRKLAETCAAFEELKKRTDVIFESANTSDQTCNFSFKVKHESVAEVLAWVKDFHPKEISENTYTIKRQIDDFTNEVDVLQKKRVSIDDTLDKALDAYDDITRLATNTQNADALANIINSKIALIERMTQERININTELDRLARAKAEQLDRLDYTYFNVHVFENKFIDGEQIGDSWKEAVKNFVRDLNKIVQDLTVNLILLLFFVLQWAIYAFIVLIVVKFGWKVGKNIWNR